MFGARNRAVLFATHVVALPVSIILAMRIMFVPIELEQTAGLLSKISPSFFINRQYTQKYSDATYTSSIATSEYPVKIFAIFYNLKVM